MKLVKYLGGRNPVADPITLAATASEVFTDGECLAYSSGKLTKSGVDSDGSAPLFVAVESKTIPSGGGELKVIKIDSNMLFECDAAGSVTAGTKVTLNTAATGVTATTIKGIALVIVGSAAAGKVLVALA